MLPHHVENKLSNFTVMVPDVDALVAALETRGLGTAASCDVSDATLDESVEIEY